RVEVRARDARGRGFAAGTNQLERELIAAIEPRVEQDEVGAAVAVDVGPADGQTAGVVWQVAARRGDRAAAERLEALALRRVRERLRLGMGTRLAGSAAGRGAAGV